MKTKQSKLHKLIELIVKKELKAQLTPLLEQVNAIRTIILNEEQKYISKNKVNIKSDESEDLLGNLSVESILKETKPFEEEEIDDFDMPSVQLGENIIDYEKKDPVSSVMNIIENGDHAKMLGKLFEKSKQRNNV